MPEDRIMKRGRRFLANETGGAGVEFAIVLPLVLILFFGTMASGVLMYSAVRLQDATETSARCLSAQRADCSVDDINPFAQSRYTGPALDDLAFAAEWNVDCGYRVTGNGTFNFFAGFGELSVPFSTSACYPGFE